GSFDRRDVDEHIFTAATLRLNEPIALGRIEPLHGAFRHYLLQATLRRATIIARPKRKRAPEGAQFPQERPAASWLILFLIVVDKLIEHGRSGAGRADAQGGRDRLGTKGAGLMGLTLRYEKAETYFD